MQSERAGRGKRTTFIACGAVVSSAVLAVAAAHVAVRSGWRPPDWLRFVGPEVVEPARDAGLFCREHGVPEKFCTLCHAELKGKLSMCADHGVPAAICTRCDPSAEPRYALTGICTEHRLPGHLCPLCNPALGAGEVQSDWCTAHSAPRSLCLRCETGLESKVPMCREHAVPRALCTACRPELKENFPVCVPHQLPAAFCRDPTCEAARKPAALSPASTLPRVRLRTAEVASRAGIETRAVVEGTVPQVLVAAGEVGYDETRLAHVSARVSGVVNEVFVREGDEVSAGQVLATLNSAELGMAKADYLAALPTVDLWKQALARNQELKERQGVSAKAVEESAAELRRAEAALIGVEQRLRNFALTDSDLARLAGETPVARNRFKVLAPVAGTVIRRSVAAGESVSASAQVFRVADLKHLWVHLDIYEKDLRSVAPGQAVRFHVPGLAPVEFPGKVVWIDSEVDERARTVRVRAEVESHGGLLRANMFGTARVELGPPRSALLAPREALQWEGSSFVVFVATGPTDYEPRRVLKGASFDGQTELTWAELRPGDRVVTAGSFLLKTEIQKGSIGAGCCE